MRFLELPAGKTVFNYGDKGTSLFIVLSGEVDIYTPQEIQVSQQEFISHLQTRMVNWEKLPPKTQKFLDTK